MQKKLFRITTVPISLEKLLGKQLTFMNQYYEVTAISSDEEELERVAKELGVKHHCVNLTRKITPLQDLKSLWDMYRFFKKEKPHIIHTHTPKAGLIGMMAAKLAGVKYRLHTVAGLPLMEATGIKRQILNFVEKLTYACASKVYPNSYGLQEFIIQEKFCPPQKLKVIGNGSSNGIDTDYFSPELFSDNQKNELKKQLGISDNDFVFVFVGRLVKDKGINELIAAFKEINQSKKNIKLLLVGNYEEELDPLLPETKAFIYECPEIIETGFQRDVRPYFSISNALIFPSYREGFPNVVMQAGAMGLPAIVTDINGCNEIIENNFNGIIIPTKSQKAVYQALLYVVKNPEQYKFMMSNARNKIVEKYKQEFVFEKILEEYKSL